MEFKIYRELVEKYYQNDCRELNFQNRIIIPFLEEIVSEKYDVVDSSTLYKNWKKIGRETFAGVYTPDILVVEDWKLFEKRKKKPLLVVEVKRPTADDKDHSYDEVEEYLKKSKYVILTDCITWEIYEEKLDNPTYFYLDEEKKRVCGRSVPKAEEDRIIKWIDDKTSDNAWKKLFTKINEIINARRK